MGFMRIAIYVVAVGIILFSHRGQAEDLTELQIRQEVLLSLEQVCQKPKDAGKYWDIKESGAGSAKIGIKKLLGLGVEGEIELNQKEWEGIKSSVEDFTDYRKCVQNMTPYMLPKIESLKPQNKSNEQPTRTLGGVKWERTISDVSMTLNKCSRLSNTVACDLTLLSEKRDTEFSLEGRTYLFDQHGQRSRISRAKIANFEKSLSKNYMSSLKADLIQGIPTAVRLEFDGVSTDAEYVSKLLCKVRISRHNAEYSYKGMIIQIDN